MANTVLYEVTDAVAVVTIDRPERRNALDLATCDALLASWQRAQDDDEVQVVVVTGVGGKAFCAGFDVADKTAGVELSVERFAPRVGTRSRIDKPVIAAVNGPAVAAGVALVEACDLCVAAETAWFALNEVTLGIGLEPFVQSLWSLPQKVLIEMMMTGKPLPARRAYDVGFVNQVAPDGQALSCALELARTIAANAPLIVRASKEMVYRGHDAMGMTEALREAERAFAPAAASDDAKEGFRARRERRPPVWRGR
jgi:enoyl-CoA hydratase/carnithine racemase